jgi:hypothetical protein
MVKFKNIKMKKNITKILYVVLFIIVFTACENNEEVETPNFKVSINQVAKVGEEVTFTIENAPDFLVFYSGEFGKEYEHRNRTNLDGTVNMSFEAAQNWQNGTSLSNPGLSIQYSKDYDGSGTPDAVATANWTDISDRFTLPTARSYNWTASGDGDVTDIASELKPVYIAYKILSTGKTSEGNRQGEYRLYNININLSVDNLPAPLPVADMFSINWQMVNMQGENTDVNKDQWVYWTGNPDFFRMNGTSADYTNEDWLITEPLNLTAVSPDKPENVKSYSENINDYTFTYSSAGTYKATFVGNNTTIYGSQQQILELTIEVTN